jgi:gamma-glutamyl:cysteine ligase YbdK (ATP-grasp superfamily)
MTSPLRLFEAAGIELEYMLVHADSLDVAPQVDRLFASATGQPVSDFSDGPLTWSNELVRHVMELKVTEPVPSLTGWAQRFQQGINRMNTIAARDNLRLLPTAMHPWMDPARETQLWPLESTEIYQTYHRIFDCYRHGWANLQSMHINLPFADEEEFALLHAAIRLVLPLLPALAAASPIMEGRRTGLLDNRLAVYLTNSQRFPEITGQAIPEPVYTRAAYQAIVFDPMMRAIAPHDPDGLLEQDFLNARGAIARFDRGAIEIRLLDVQECPAADLAIAHWTIHAVRRLVDRQRAGRRADIAACPVGPLRLLLEKTLLTAEQTPVTDDLFLSLWEWPSGIACTAGALCDHIAEDLRMDDPDLTSAWKLLRAEGPLARRMLNTLSPSPTRAELHHLTGRLADALATGHLFVP